MDCRFLMFTLFLFLEYNNTSSKTEISTTKLNKMLLNKTSTSNIQTTNTFKYTNKQTTLNFTRNNMSSSRPNKKWKVERLATKQYGIINILWQRTNVFLDWDYCNLTCKPTTIRPIPEIKKNVASEHKVFKSTLQAKGQTSTPSKIEFYYLEPGDDRIKRKNRGEVNLQNRKSAEKNGAYQSNNKKSYIPMVFRIHVNTFPSKRTSRKNGQSNFYHARFNQSKQTTFVSNVLTPFGPKPNMNGRNDEESNNFGTQKPVNTFTIRTTAITIGSIRKKSNKKKIQQERSNIHRYTGGFVNDKVLTKYMLTPSPATFYDKVKFFEMYDNNTPKLDNYIVTNMSNMFNFLDVKEKKSLKDEQIRLHHVNNDTGYQHYNPKNKYVKKHIKELFIEEEKANKSYPKNSTRPDVKNISEYYKFSPVEKNFKNSIRPAIWSDFPFLAVYIYEPTHVRCDAAGISSHWLIAAASCLSKHHKELQYGGLSAFVSFCGNSGEYPQTMSYVKRTLIHPLYRPKDKRYLYNGGLVEVVNSMADTCSGWTPASLMSHQFTADEKGSMGMAVGWGDDQSDTSTNIPRNLMIYEDRVYSNSCPGNLENRKTKNIFEVANRNVYCMPLPSVGAEENGTIHGALLLIGGKLVALYLKEERLRQGAWSVLYTGIWQWLPWLTETAREPHDVFQFEI